MAAGIAIGIEPPDPASVTIVGKLAAALAAAASVAFVHLTAARLAGRRIALVVATLYAFGTVTWPISAGALWMHGPAQLWVSAGLFLVTSRTSTARGRSGLAYGLAAMTRPATSVFFAAAIVHLLRDDRSAARRAILWATPAAAVLLAYNAVAFGSVVSPYYERREGGDLLVGLAGLLVSPSRGLLIYSPFLALGAYELVRSWWRGGVVAHALRWQSLAALATLLLYAGFLEWEGGHSYGSRYFAETLPLLSCGLALWMRRHYRRAGAGALVFALGAPSVIIAALGASFYDWSGSSWERLAPYPELLWRPDIAQPWHTLQRALASPDPLGGLGLAALVVGLALIASVARYEVRRARVPARPDPAALRTA